MELIINYIKKVFLGIIITMLFVVPLTIFFVNQFQVKDTKIMKKIENKENLILLISNNNCSNCNELNKTLEKTSTNSYYIDINNTKRYNDLLSLIGIESTDIISPTVIYIEEGKLVSSLPNIQDEKELITFLNNYNLT